MDWQVEQFDVLDELGRREKFSGVVHLVDDRFIDTFGRQRLAKTPFGFLATISLSSAA